MVRITLYDPKISAEVYSRRRAAEQGFDSGVAAGLARLGRALSEREQGFRRAGAGAMAVREALGFWEGEVRRLDALGAKIPPGKPGFHDLAMKDHLARRTETIARLKETDPEQAALFDLRTRPLVEMLERRASAMEAEASGQTLSAGMGGALAIAAKTVRADPLQHDAIRDGLAETLSEMERNGVDAGALARVRASADRSLAMAAIGGLIDDRQFDAARELLAEGRMPALTPEDRGEQERRVGRAERRAKATGSAETAAAEDAYWAGFQSLAAGLREGGEASDLRYTDDSIRAALPEAQAEKMIALRDAAEDAGEAYGRVALASPDTIDALIAGAGPEEARHLRAAARDRDRRLAEDPAAFVLGNTRVRAVRDAWQAALAGDDPEAIASAARTYAQASLDEQRRLGVAAAGRRVLPAESAAAMVTAFTAAERPDPAGLGAELRARFGEHWRPVLEDLKAAGLPEGMAAIAAMDRPDQQAAAQRLSALVATSTAELRERVGEEAAGQIDAHLNPSDTDAETARRLAYALAASGEAPDSASKQAVRSTTKRADGDGKEDGSDRQSAWLGAPYDLDRQRQILALFDNILSASPDQFEAVEGRIFGVFADSPEFAERVAFQARSAILGDGQSVVSPEAARRTLSEFSAIMAAGGEPDHGRAARWMAFVEFERQTPYQLTPAAGGRVAFSQAGDSAPFMTLPQNIAARLVNEHEGLAEIVTFLSDWRSGRLSGDALRAEAERLLIRSLDDEFASAYFGTAFWTGPLPSVSPEDLMDRTGLEAFLAADELLSEGFDEAAVMAALIPAVMPELFEDGPEELILGIILDVLPIVGNVRSANDAIEDFEALQAALERGDWRATSQAGLFTVLDVAGALPGLGNLLGPLIRRTRSVARRVPGLRLVEARVQVWQWERNFNKQFGGTSVQEQFGQAWHMLSPDKQVSIDALHRHIVGKAGENFAADTLERATARIVRGARGEPKQLALQLIDPATGQLLRRRADINVDESNLRPLMNWLFGFGRADGDRALFEIKVGTSEYKPTQADFDRLLRKGSSDVMRLLRFPLEEIPAEYLIAETTRLLEPWVQGKRRIRFTQADVDSFVEALRRQRHSSSGQPASVFDWMMALALIEAAEGSLSAGVFTPPNGEVQQEHHLSSEVPSESGKR